MHHAQPPASPGGSLSNSATDPTSSPDDLELSRKKQELENLRLEHQKVELEIFSLRKSEWRKPATFFSLVTALGALAVVFGVFVSWRLSTVGFQRAQIAADKAQLDVERAERDTRRAEEERDKLLAEASSQREQITHSRNERDKLLTEVSSRRDDIARSQQRVNELQKQLKALKTRIEQAAIEIVDPVKLVGADGPMKLAANAEARRILDVLNVTIVFITNNTDYPIDAQIQSFPPPEEDLTLTATTKWVEDFRRVFPAAPGNLIPPHETRKFATQRLRVLDVTSGIMDPINKLGGFAKQAVVEPNIQPVEIFRFDDENDFIRLTPRPANPSEAAK